jgi:uncharacterized protein YbaA (DUF1428 family)
MTYVDGFIVAVPTANKEAYKAHAEKMLPLLDDFGATRLVEGWGDSVPRGELNDLYRAVDAKDDETVLFSWIEYPDKATRDAAGAKMMSDPRLQDMGEMPFDGSRMIYAGFEGLSEEGARGECGYIDGIVLPVPVANRQGYRDFCTVTAAAFRDHGATRVVDGWGSDVPDGKQTDFKRAALVQDGETVVFGWVEWPSKAVRDTAWEKLMTDERLANAGRNQPFDGKRMMFGGFTPIVDR